VRFSTPESRPSCSGNTQNNTKATRMAFTGPPLSDRGTNRIILRDSLFRVGIRTNAPRTLNLLPRIVRD